MSNLDPVTQFAMILSSVVLILVVIGVCFIERDYRKDIEDYRK